MSTPLPEQNPLIQSTPSNNNNVVLYKVLAAVFLFITAVAMTVPVRPLLILQAAGKDASKASLFSGTVDTLQSLLAIFLSPLFGAVSDIIGRKPILILSQIGEVIGLLLIAQFPFSLIAQFPAYVIIALSNCYSTTVHTIIADISTYSAISAATNFGYLGSIIGAAFLIGPILGGIIEDSFYVASSFHVAVAIIIVAMTFVYLVVPETLDTSDAYNNTSTSWRENAIASATRIARAIRNTELNPLPRIKRIFLQNEALTYMAISLSLLSLAQGGLNSIIFLYASVRLGWEAKDTGLFLSMLGLSLMISQSILAPFSVRVIGEVATIIIGYSFSALHYIIYGIAQTTATMYIGLFVGMLSFVADPAVKGLLARQVSKDSQGSLQGSLSALSNVVRPFSSILSATLFSIGMTHGYPGLPFFVIGGVAAIAMLFMRVALWKPGLK